MIVVETCDNGMSQFLVGKREVNRSDSKELPTLLQRMQIPRDSREYAIPRVWRSKPWDSGAEHHIASTVGQKQKHLCELKASLGYK